MSPASGLLERAEQLQSLHSHWTAVKTTSSGRVVAVSGEAGAGKTTLIRHFCAEAEGRPTVRWGACDPLFTASPLGPFIDIAEGFPAIPAITEIIERGGRPDELASVLLAEMRRSQAIIVVLEDLHWADEATLDVLRLLARRVETRGALVLVTYRDDELDRGHPLRRLLGELPTAVARLKVPPFSEAAVASLAEAEGGGVDTAELYRKTAGNPFFVTEVLASEQGWVPDTVREAVLARASRLGPEAYSLLEAIAVGSPHASLWLVDNLAPDSADQLDRCLSSGIIQAEGTDLSFRHELARLAVEEALYPGRRLALHRLALQALSEHPTGRRDLARLARHAEAAADVEAVLRFAPEAAIAAAAVGAHREAAAQYARALEFADHLEPAARAVLLTQHSQECYLADSGAEAIASGQAAVALFRQLGDLLAEADSLLKLSTIQRINGLNAEAGLSVSSALELLGQVPRGRPLAMAYAATAQIAMCNADLSQTHAAGAEALRLAEEFDDTETLVHVLTSVGTAEMEVDSSRSDGRAKLTRSVRLAKETGLGEAAARAYNNLIYEDLVRHDLPSVEISVNEAVEWSKARGLDLWLHCALGSRSELALLRGDWSAAVEDAAMVLSQQTAAVPRVGPLTVLGLVRARRGDPDPWRPLDEALTIAGPTGELQMVAPVACARAEAAWLEGRPDAVLEETEELVRRALRSNDNWALSELAYWRWQAGIREDIATRDSPWWLQMNGQAPRAAREWAECGCQYYAALAHADSGEQSALRQALEDLQGLGARAAAAIVARRLREQGVRGLPRGPRPSTALNPAGLTRREMEVLVLVAEGLRDAEVAARLFLSEKTVGHHVSAILRKLGVRTRGQATAEAARLALVDRLPI